jgi:hypothetical protein
MTSDIRWTHGRTVRLAIAEDVADQETLVSRASYALLFARGDHPLGRTLQIELAPLGVDIDVRTPDPMAEEILVNVVPCRWRLSHETRAIRHDRWD